MKSIGAVLLAYSLSAQLISKLNPIPFIGLAVTLLGFPLALKLSLKELFVINLADVFFALTLQIDMFILNANYMFSIFSYSIENLSVYVIGVLSMALLIALVSALLMKYVSKYTPKRIKEILNEA